MSGRLKDEIAMTKAFESLEVEAFLNIQRTADQLMRAVAEALKPFDLSPTQYNVLRILCGAGPGGLACSEIAERMVNKDPDITRLLDRMEDRGWVIRDRDKGDRRVVIASVTAKGTGLVRQAAEPLAELNRRQLGKLSQKELHSLIDLLERLRCSRE